MSGTSTVMANGKQAVAEDVDGAELLVRTLMRLDVSHAFNIPGLGMFPLVDAFYRHRDEIKYVTALNETNLALMAAGYARATRKPAFVDVYHSSGTGLAMMAVTTAWAESTPLVVCTTTTAVPSIARDQYAGVPRAITEMSQQYVKWSAEVPTVDRIPEMLERAFLIAGTPPYGPVHIAIPMDLLTETTADDGDLASGAADLAAFREFAPEQAGIDRIIAVLDGCERPIMVLGAEVRRYGAVEQALKLAELLQCPVVSDPFYGDLGLPTNHPQHIGKLGSNKDVFAQADVSLIVGADLAPPYTHELPFADGAEVIAIDTDPNALLRQFRPTIGLLGTPAATLEAIAAGLAAPAAASLSARREWTAGLRQRHCDRAAALLEIETKPGDPMSMGSVVDALCSGLPEDIVLVNQAGTAQYHLEMLFPSHPERYYGVSGKASAQGYGGPAALGVQLGTPDSRVVAVLGDGGMLFTGTSLYTASRFNIPVIFVIANNGGWASIKSVMRFEDLAGQVSDNEFGFAFNEPPVDIVGFAESQGLPACRVQDRASLDEALRTALATDGPFLIDVSITPDSAEDFINAM